MRFSCSALMPFLLDAMIWAAITHLQSGILLRSMTVPTVTVKGLRQSLHLWTPGRVLLPLSLVIRSPKTPHRRSTRLRRAAACANLPPLVPEIYQLSMILQREETASLCRF